MKKRRISRFNKEKVTMLVSSLLVIGACVATGLYINGKGQKQEENSVVDFAKLESGNESAKNEEEAENPAVQADSGNVAASIVDNELDVDPYYQETNSQSVINPGLSGNSIKQAASGGENSTEANEAESDDAQTNENAAHTESESKPEEDAQTMTSKNIMFKDDQKLSWPVAGNIIMNYSMDKTILFQTLNQYKYNPAIIIGAAINENVKSPAPATIKKIGNDTEIGKYVTLDLGGGFVLTIGQLDNITLKEGDVVDKGDAIGSVAKATKYYSIEGDNVYLKLEKDGVITNPMLYLE